MLLLRLQYMCEKCCSTFKININYNLISFTILDTVWIIFFVFVFLVVVVIVIYIMLFAHKANTKATEFLHRSISFHFSGGCFRALLLLARCCCCCYWEERKLLREREKENMWLFLIQFRRFMSPLLSTQYSYRC